MVWEKTVALSLICFLVVLQTISSTVEADADDNLDVIMRAVGWAIVLTNESTNVEENSARLHSYLVDDGAVLCQLSFEYDVDSGEPYSSNTVWIGDFNSPYEFNQAISGLIEGELYFFRARAKNINGVSYGNEKKFLTKPDPVTNFQAVRNGIIVQVDLSWDKGDGADKTIIVRKIGAYPVDRSDGTTIYNGTADTYEDAAVVTGTHYYYRAWSYCSEDSLYQHSDDFDEDSCLALAPATFDVRDIMIIDSVTPHLGISVIVENRGGILTDITVFWELEQVDTGVLLDAGSDTFAVAGHTEYTYVIYPTVTYVGQVKITFVGDGASASGLFYTQAPSGGGGGVFVPPRPPTPVPPSFAPPPPILEFTLESVCPLILIIIGIIIFFIFLIWKYREEEKKKKRRRKKRKKRKK